MPEIGALRSRWTGRAWRTLQARESSTGWRIAIGFADGLVAQADSTLQRDTDALDALLRLVRRDRPRHSAPVTISEAVPLLAPLLGWHWALGAVEYRHVDPDAMRSVVREEAERARNRADAIALRSEAVRLGLREPVIASEPTDTREPVLEARLRRAERKRAAAEAEARRWQAESIRLRKAIFAKG